MSDEELEEAVEATTLFAKLSPQQKARIVRVLKGKGHTVGFLGDGMNDGPALREADIGISVDTGADIARESAEIILLEKSLLVLEHGVLLGRATYGNIIKYIKMAASSNFGNMLSVMAAAAWLPFLPMLPLQILIQNLLYDFSQTAIPFDHVDPEYPEEPTQMAGRRHRPLYAVGGAHQLDLRPHNLCVDVVPLCREYAGQAGRSSNRAGSSRACCRRP